jgi:hypothetical protein
MFKTTVSKAAVGDAQPRHTSELRPQGAPNPDNEAGAVAFNILP